MADPEITPGGALVPACDDDALHERLAHDREMFALKVRATIAALPAAIGVLYFCVWLIGGMLGHPAPVLDKIFIELISGCFGAAMAQLGTSYVEAKRQERIRRDKN